MKNFKVVAIMAIVITCLFSCQKEEINNEPGIIQEAPAYILEKIVKQGVNPKEVKRHVIEVGNIKRSGWLADDIFFSDDKLKLMEDIPLISENVSEKLYRTRHLVGVPITGQREIKIIGFDIPASFQRALTGAVGKYNALNLRFRLELSFGRIPQPIDDDVLIVVFTNTNVNGLNGSAEFPFNRNPGETFELDRGLANLPANILEYFMMHELGHAFGLRHSDLRTHSSCPPGQSFDEQADPRGIELGARLIPGTNPSGDFQESIMRKCIGDFAVAEFFPEDIAALRRLY